MFYHVQKLINPSVADEPDPLAANALQEGLGGQFGEMRTMMQYLFQSFNFRGNAGCLQLSFNIRSPLLTKNHY